MKKQILLALLICSFITCGKVEVENRPAEADGVEVLLVLSQNYGANTFLYQDLFEQYGWHVTVAGVADLITACPSIADKLDVPPVTPDVSLLEVDDISRYDVVAVMPASASFSDEPHADLLNHAQVMSLVSKAVEDGLVVAAWCAGSRVLAAADVLRGKSVVGSPKFEHEYVEAGAAFLGNDNPPVVDGNLVTAVRGMYYSVQNSMAVATALEASSSSESASRRFDSDIVLSTRSIERNDSVEGISWTKIYGGVGSNGGRALCRGVNGGFLLVGYTFSRGGDSDVMVIKTDSSGKVVWSKAFGGAGVEYGNACLTTRDSYLVTGFTTSSGAGSRDVIAIRLDEQGAPIWTKTYGGKELDVGTALAETREGRYVIGGFTRSLGAGEEDVYLIEIDLEGNLVWHRSFGGSRSEMGCSVHAVPDGGYVMGATTGTFGKGNCDFFLIRTDDHGNEIWSKPYGNKGRRGYGYDWMSASIPLRDGGWVLVGHTDARDILDIDVTKVDTEGRPVWSKILGYGPFYDYGNAVVETADGGLVVCGTTKTVRGDNDILLAGLDSAGNLLWKKKLGGPGSDWGKSLMVTEDGDYVVLGQAREGRLPHVLLAKIEKSE